MEEVVAADEIFAAESSSSSFIFKGVTGGMYWRTGKRKNWKNLERFQ